MLSIEIVAVTLFQANELTTQLTSDTHGDEQQDSQS
jgi:hypothetical protein